MAQHFPESVPAGSEFHLTGRAGWSHHQKQNTPSIVDEEGEIRPPGYVLPQAVCTTGALFGTLAASGTAEKLAFVAKQVRARLFFVFFCRARDQGWRSSAVSLSE